MLRNIEQLTRRKVDVAQIPTVLDVRARRLEITRATLRETILAGETDGFRVVVESLADEFDLMDIAMASVQLAHSALAGDDDADGVEIPVAGAPAERSRPDHERARRSPGGAPPA